MSLMCFTTGNPTQKGYTHDHKVMLDALAVQLFASGLRQATFVDPTFTSDQKYVHGSDPSTTITIHTRHGSQRSITYGVPSMPLGGMGMPAGIVSMVVPAISHTTTPAVVGTVVPAQNHQATHVVVGTVVPAGAHVSTPCCGLCHGTNHTTDQHRCGTCGGLGHRARDCPSGRHHSSGGHPGGGWSGSLSDMGVQFKRWS